MRPDRIATLRHDTVEMFYHGYDNYMKVAFPDDEVCLHSTALVWSRNSALTSCPTASTSHMCAPDQGQR
jgi:hypothetical protein